MKDILNPFLKMYLFCILVISIFLNVGFSTGVTIPKFHELPHDYWNAKRNDPFTKIIPLLHNGQIKLDHSSELNFLKSLLKELHIPESSQLQLFSTTSLQLGLINPSNPRALYFNESVYIGYIPGGKIEVISIDPEYGAVFYIFKVPSKNQPLTITPTKRCMNCHADRELSGIPGLIIKSVLPGVNGGSLDSFRTGQPGHNVPYKDRFGGWFITDLLNQNYNHNYNVLGYYKNGSIEKKNILSIQKRSINLFPHSNSEILTHLIFDHQAGFVNRAIKANYLLRLTQLPDNFDQNNQNFKKSISDLVSYSLFNKEPDLPFKINHTSHFKSDFLNTPYKLKTGESLRHLDLKSRLFKYRCSFMLFSDFFKNNPTEIKKAVYKQIQKNLFSQKSSSTSLNLFSKIEKEVISQLLKEFYK